MRRLIALPLLLALVACPAPIDTGPDGGGAIVVGPDGGRFIREGAFIDIPRGAVTAQTILTVEVLDTGLPEVPGRTRISYGFRFIPSTLKFNEPVTIGIPFIEERLPSKAIDRSTLDVRRRTGDDPYLQLPSPRVLAGEPVITARTDGTGTFWATSPDKPAVSELRITPNQVTLAVAQTAQLTAEVTDPAGAPLEDVEVRWTIAPARVASVDAAGLVTALDPGTAIVTATAVGLTQTVPIYVVGTTASPTTFLHENPFPTGNDLLGGALAQGGQLLLVGRNGTVLSREGQTAWTRHFSSPGLDLRGVGGTLPGPAVAVGTQGNNGVLVELASAEAAPNVKVLSSVQPRALWFDGTHGMAVGDGNDVLIRRDGEWVTDYSPSFERLLDVKGDGQGSFVTVGARGSLYVYKASTRAWDSLFQTQLSVLLSAAVIDDAQGSGAWAVGGGKLWRFESQAWTALNLPTEPAVDELTAVGLVEGRVVLGARAGRQGHLLVYDPGAQSFTTQPLRTPQLIRAIIADPDAGAGYAVGDFGAVWRWANGTFTELSSGFYGDVADLYVTSDAVVAAVNECADSACNVRVGRVYRRGANGTWQPLGSQPFGSPLRAIAARSATDVWAGGQGVLWRFDGASWTPTVLTGGVNDIVVCGDEYWAVGDTGSIVRGTTTPMVAGQRGTRNLFALHCQNAGEVWAAGDEALYRNQTPLGDPAVRHAPWRAVWSPGAGEAFMFGDARYGTYWNGQRMVVYDQPGGVLPNVIEGLWGASVDTLYAVGHTVVPQTHGFALRFNGAQWTPIDSGASRRAMTIHGRSASEVWLGTEGGGILRGLMPAPAP